MTSRTSRIRLATFNLKDFFVARPGRDPDEVPIVEAKLDSVAASLRRASADVVALQEVGSPVLLGRLLERAPELGYGDPVVGTPDRRGIGCAILSRLPVQWSQIHESPSLAFPTFVEGDPAPFPGRVPLRRGVVHVRVDGGELGEIDVLTGHFKSGRPARQRTKTGEEKVDRTPFELGESLIRSFVQRSAEALFVRHLVDAVFAKSEDHAICVMGDLNDVVESLSVRLVRGLNPSSKHYLHAAADRAPAEKRFTVLHGGRRSLIDHVLLSERIHRAVTSVEIHNDTLRDHGPAPDDGPLTVDSDHALTVVTVEAPLPDQSL